MKIKMLGNHVQLETSITPAQLKRAIAICPEAITVTATEQNGDIREVFKLALTEDRGASCICKFGCVFETAEDKLVIGATAENATKFIENNLLAIRHLQLLEATVANSIAMLEEEIDNIEVEVLG